jgi:ABC-type uncharacterized transport system substrate-binding protein
LVRLKVDVIVAAAYTAAAAKGATSTIPIVMTNDGDPVWNRLVVSLARPGGNVTGLSAQALDLVGKQLKAVVALAHTLLRIVYQVLADGTTYRELGGDYYDRQHTQRAARPAIRLLEIF